MTSKNRNTNIIYHWSIVLIFFAALAIRLYDFDDPPLDFHPARQLHSALIARAEFLNHEEISPDLMRNMSMKQLCVAFRSRG